MSTARFFDYQATTPLDERVLEVMLPWFSRPANPHSVQHDAGIDAAQAVDEAREQLGSAVGLDGESILFTPSATFACNQVIRSFGLPNKKIVVSAIEHPCVVETAKWCEVHGAELQIIPVGSDGIIDLDAAFELSENASIVSIMAVNNEVGTVQPIHELAEFCSSQGTIFHTDAAQALGRIDLIGLAENAIITLSSHKAYGPQGIGSICAAPAVLARLQALITGGGQQKGLHPGTIPTALAVGFGYAASLAVSEREADWAHCAMLSDRLLQQLGSHGVRFKRNGNSAASVPHNLNLSFDGVDADALLALLPQLALATGSACSSGAMGKSKVLAAMGLAESDIKSAVRIGFGRPSRAAEVDEAAHMIANAVSRLLEKS